MDKEDLLHTAGGKLSPDAPEFIPSTPMTAPFTEESSIAQDPVKGASAELPLSEAFETTVPALVQPARKVLGELTNTIAMGYASNKEIFQKKGDESEPPGLGGLGCLFGGAENSLLRSRTVDEPIMVDGEAQAGNISDIEEEGGQSHSGTGSSCGSEGDAAGAGGDASDEEDASMLVAGEAPTPVSEDQPLPSIGSADHVAGTCRRCNFFPKGRCQNGQDCTFCHYTHERRKPSRQEKRERLVAWQQQQIIEVGGYIPAINGEAESPLKLCELGDAQADGQVLLQGSLTASMNPLLPGLPAAFCAIQLPSPLPLPGASPTASSAAPCAPTRLPPGLPPPERQPEDEASPPCLPLQGGQLQPQPYGCGFTPLLATSPVQSPMQSPLAASHSCRPILATVPGGPAAEVANQTLLNAAQPRSPASVAATSAEKGQPPSIEGKQWRQTTSAATQTEESGEEITEDLPRELSPEEKATHWPREELLRLREPLLQEKEKGGDGEAAASMPRAAIVPAAWAARNGGA
jgi:hypothetical protein